MDAIIRIKQLRFYLQQEVEILEGKCNYNGKDGGKRF